MKTALIVPLLAIITATCQARVWETPAEITTRYGEGKKAEDRLKVPGAETFHYEANGFGITVIFLDGKSVWEMFERKGKEITDEDIKELLKVNGVGHSWRFDKKNNRWERGDNKLVAFREPGHSDFFSIRDLDVMKSAEAGTKPKNSGF